MSSPFLLETLRLAETRAGFCAPNPAVGAVLVRDGEIIERGVHRGPGTPHAEADLLSRVPDEALRGATLFVSLEPCCHTKKRTPPCAELLIQRRVERVVYAHLDPNPQVSGQGQARLREAGIDCRHERVEAIETFYEPYDRWTRTRRPYVTAKLAVTLDGKAALADGRPCAITGAAARERTHAGRRQADAILTSARTVLADDPQLNVRAGGEAPIGKPVYVLDARGEVPPTARLFSTASKVTLFVAEGGPAASREGAVALPARDGRLDPEAVLEAIGRDGVHELWVEAGPTLFDSWRAAGLLQRALVYVAPKWLGADGASAFPKTAENPFAGYRSLQWSGAGADGICEVRW